MNVVGRNRRVLVFQRSFGRASSSRRRLENRRLILQIFFFGTGVGSVAGIAVTVLGQPPVRFVVDAVRDETSEDWSPYIDTDPSQLFVQQPKLNTPPTETSR
jgi:hypothetical protein